MTHARDDQLSELPPQIASAREPDRPGRAVPRLRRHLRRHRGGPECRCGRAAVRAARPLPPPACGPSPREGPADRGRYAEDYDDYEEERYRRRPRRDVLPHRGSTVLVLGILSLIVCAPVLGPIAWSMGHTDLQEIRAG